MHLPVLNSAATEPWYGEGLKFTCTTCGNCCTGGPGYVWVSDEEIRRVAAHLTLSTTQMRKDYCRRVFGRISFKERVQPNGNHDCIFLTEIPAPPTAAALASDGSADLHELQPGESPPLTRRVCSIYSVRPLQCRTWPFWRENLKSEDAWNRASRGCPGMGQGHRHFARERIEALRDAEDWPDRPPTSSGPE